MYKVQIKQVHWRTIDVVDTLEKATELFNNLSESGRCRVIFNKEVIKHTGHDKSFIEKEKERFKQFVIQYEQEMEKRRTDGTAVYHTTPPIDIKHILPDYSTKIIPQKLSVNSRTEFKVGPKKLYNNGDQPVKRNKVERVHV